MVQKKTIKKSTKSAGTSKKSPIRSTKKKYTVSKKQTTNIKKAVNKKETKNNYIIHTIVILIGIIILLFAFNNIFNNSPESDIVATIDDLTITSEELSAAYNKLPAEFKGLITKEQYLEELFIPQKVILIKAKSIDESKVNEEYQKIISESKQTEEEIMAQLALSNVSKDEFMDSVRIQLYLQEALKDKLAISEDELSEFYNSNKDSIVDESGTVIPFEEVKEDLEAYLKNQKLQEETAVYVEELKSEMKIEIFLGNIGNSNPTQLEKPITSEITEYSFDITNDELCSDNGKPIVRMFSTTWCPHCKWATDVFENAIKPFVESNQIVAYHWELDVNDNALTSEVETTIPNEELAIYKKYNPSGSIPTFVFGCRYSRIGNGYEGKEGGEAKELAEFTKIIKELVAESN